MKTINAIATFFVCFFLLHFDFIEIKETEYKVIKISKKYEEKCVTDDAKVIKDILFKLLEKQIQEFGFFKRYFASETIEQISKQLAVYYNQILKFEDEPEKVIKLANEMIENSQAYIEIALVYLKQTKCKLEKEYNAIKGKYCSYFDNIFNNQDWKEKITIKEVDQIDKLELQMNEIEKVQNIINKIKTLFKFISWTSYSHSPFAWAIRKYIGL